jgi:hypothetical protein
MKIFMKCMHLLVSVIMGAKRITKLAAIHANALKTQSKVAKIFV